MVVVADVIVIVVLTVIETLLALLVYRFRIQSVTPCFGKRQREKVSEGNKKSSLKESKGIRRLNNGWHRMGSAWELKRAIAERRIGYGDWKN